LAIKETVQAIFNGKTGISDEKEQVPLGELKQPSLPVDCHLHWIPIMHERRQERYLLSSKPEAASVELEVKSLALPNLEKQNKALLL
jgi:hypothetical protein